MTNMIPRRKFLSVIGATCTAMLLGAPTAYAQSKFEDPLDYPAQSVNSLEKRPFMAITEAGDHLVAVGSRGLIAISRDGGKSWTQAKVPVQCDLLAVNFPDATSGWAVGHDGVVLRSSDGGETWEKQLDGREAGAAFRKFYATRATGGDVAAKNALAQVDQNFKVGGALPYLDVWFEDARTGYAVGSFGMLIATTDGGQHWVPWLERIDNTQSLNLNSIRGVGGDVLIAGERGMVYKLDRAANRFSAVSTGYAGSFFGVAGNPKTTVVFGLRGVAFRSVDHGLTWQRLAIPSGSTITGGTVRERTGEFLLVNGAGQLLVGNSDAEHFDVSKTPLPTRLTGVVAKSDGSVVVTGLGGVTEESRSR